MNKPDHSKSDHPKPRLGGLTIHTDDPDVLRSTMAWLRAQQRDSVLAEQILPEIEMHHTRVTSVVKTGIKAKRRSLFSLFRNE